MPRKALPVTAGWTVEAERFAGTHTCARQQSDRHRQSQRPLGTARRDAAARRDERSELPIAQDARWRNGATSGERTSIERLGPRVVDGEILAKAAKHPVMDGATVGRPLP